MPPVETTSPVDADGSGAPFAIRIDVVRPLYAAAAAHGIGPVGAVEIRNTGTAPQRDLIAELTCRPALLSPAKFALDTVPPGADVAIREPRLLPDLARLRELIEADTATIAVRLLRDGTPVASATAPLPVLAHNEWDARDPRLLAAFVMPNHPAITELVAEARTLQEQQFGRAALDGYQANDVERVKQQAAAVYGALQRIGITYLGVPASFEAGGQKLRFPDTLRTTKQGNCIEVATWFAAGLEACGLQPVIVLLRGHAFGGVWLTNEPRSLDPIETDAATVRKLQQTGRLLLVETTAATSRPPITFAQACREATTKIEDATFQELLDVHGLRASGIKPLNVGADGAAASAGSPVATPDLSLPVSPAIPTPSPRSDKTRRRFDVWIDDLIDLSLRNDLIGGTMSEDPASFGGLRPRKGLLLAVPDAAAFENDLEEEKTFRLDTTSPPPPDQSDRAALEAFEARLAECQQQQVIVVDPGAEALPEKLRKVWKKHRQLLEEKGTSSLHVALGHLRWFESDSSHQPRYAPLLLVPVHLERVSLAGEFTLSMADAETALNAALVQKLKREFGVDLSALAAELPEDDYGTDVDAVFTHITQAVIRLRRFEVLRITTLGFFEYRKQLMAHDLKAMLASGARAPNAFIASMVPDLAQDPTYQYADGTSGWRFPVLHELDERIPAGTLPLVVDADSSQLGAVQAAMEGRSFVLQGPPGTGKSQTITNIIATLLAAGKRVLFAAEKRAALSVVSKRLADAGLRSACLELHGTKADPGGVARSLVEALEATRPADTGTFERCAKDVDETRARLNAFVRRLHAPTPLGMSFFRASARRHELRDREAPALEDAAVLETTAETFQARLRALEALQGAIADCGGWAGNPFRAARLDVWTERRQDDARAVLDELLHAATAASTALGDAARSLGIDPGAAACAPDTVVEMLALLASAPPAWVRSLSVAAQRDDYLRALDELCTVATRRATRLASLASRWTDRLHELDLTALATAIRQARTRWSLLRWWALRAPRRTLRGAAKGKLADLATISADLDEALAAREDAKLLDGASQAIAQLMGPAFAGARTEPATFARANDARRWTDLVSALVATIRRRGGAPPDARLALPALDATVAAELADLLKQAVARVRTVAERTVEILVLDRREAFGDADPALRLDDVASFARSALGALTRLRDKTASERAARHAEELGLAPFVAALRDNRVPEDAIAETYEAAFLKVWVSEMTDAHDELAQFRGRQHDRVIEAFRRADRDLLAAGRERALYDVARRRPAAGGAAHAESEVGILRREAMKTRSRMPVRKLLAALPTLVPRLKPCFLMSPLAVAHFLPVDVEKFDTVIFDEASQVPTADAIGALWRGRQVIVVGDSKQMPPTDFFNVSLDDDEDADVGLLQGLESILDEAVASGIPALMLAWHYRSRDERLIAFSNRHYYDGRLLTFPAADPASDGSGVFYERVSGVFDRGASRRNEGEARRVVDIIVERLRAPGTRERSIGVVTFNVQQQDLIETLLDRARLEFPEIEPYFTSRVSEPVFVKNLESVQGDERDVMIFSTTYGRDHVGRMSVNFGPMNRLGGERRLNVAITRARERLIVVTSMDPEEIDLGRTGSVGVRHFREFLRFARDGVRALIDGVRVDDAAECESPFERDVLAACEALGWTVDRQVGCSGYRIDLAVTDPRLPGRHLLGIECDGATYHSAATARDRDRLRQAVLENLGWTLHRIWSTDWRVDRDGEIQRLKRAYDAALAAPRRPLGAGANRELKESGEASAEGSRPYTVPRGVGSSAAPVGAAKRGRATPPGEPVDPATVTDAQRRQALVAVLHESGSMPMDALVKAAATRVGHRRVGSRIRVAFERLVHEMLASGKARRIGDRIGPAA